MINIFVSVIKLYIKILFSFELGEENPNINGNPIENFDANFNELDKRCFFSDGIRKIGYYFLDLC